MASLVIAYLLWATCGWFGLHHFYLGRDLQASLWSISLGGFFVGWLRDFYRLPDMVALANGGDAYKRLTAAQREVYPVPSWSFTRLCGMYLFAILLGSILSSVTTGIFSSIGWSVGAWAGIVAVGNLGGQTCRWGRVAIAVGVMACFRILMELLDDDDFLNEDNSSPFREIFFGSMVALWTRKVLQ